LDSGAINTMESGYYAAFAGLVAKTQALELVANNLANLNTNGYKGQREFYRSLEASLQNARLSPLNRAVNDFGVLGGALVDMRTGTLERTGNDLDLALEGSGFFVVQTPAGLRYTRNGSFRLSPTGGLLSVSGDPVLGEQGPITLPPGQVSISADGTLSVKGSLVGRLRVVDLAAGVRPEGNTYFTAPAGSERPVTDRRVRQGALESANLTPISESVSLVALQRHAELLQRALAIFHTDFNRTAIEELPRV
jgi:flagellar basal-body rod protein FlgF